LGSIWLVRFDPSVGTEIRKTRPAVIISGTVFNRRSKVTVLPLTTSNPRDRRLLSIMISITPSDTNGLDVESFLICVEPMTFDKKRLVKYIGQLEDNQIQQFKSILRRYLDFN
jgi:mRNA interferase MazF